jgi:polyhydroxybutyrate depolymerase
MPVMHIHGTNDLIVFYNGGAGNKSVTQVLELWRGFSNCPAEAVVVNLPDIVAEGSTVQTYTWAPCDDLAEVVHYKVVNGGHSWPGSVGTTGLGNTNRDIIASDEIWKFLSRFSLNLPTAVPDIRITDFGCFPNPSENGTITIRCSRITTPGTLTIFSPEGAVVGMVTIPKDTYEQKMDISGVNPGLYFLKLQNGQGCYTTKFIVK